MARTAVLLVNLGSPDSPSVFDVRRYLKEFLSDPLVMDRSRLVQQFVLHAFILPFRPQKTSEAYRSIWTTEGSPLVATSRRVQTLLQEKIKDRVFLAMRYGNPSIPQTIQEIIRHGCDELLLFPLYPHYALSSYETVVREVRKALVFSCIPSNTPVPILEILPPFYKDPDYIRALVECSRPDLDRGFDHLLFSYHGLPERHLRLADPTGSHCLAAGDCCTTPHPAHATCYRAQCLQTTAAFVRAAGIPEGKYSVSYQSRLGRDPWIQPYTDLEIPKLAARGVRRLLVICPAFVTDCLETLEEIAIEGKALFLSSGGLEFHYVPCLNERTDWMHALSDIVLSNLVGWSDTATHETLEKSRLRALSMGAKG